MFKTKAAPARARGHKNIVHSKLYPQSACGSRKFNLSAAELLRVEMVSILLYQADPHLSQSEQAMARRLFWPLVRKILALGRYVKTGDYA